MSYPAREGSGPERLHDTCVDVSAVNEHPGSAWICVRACHEEAPGNGPSAPVAAQEPSAGGNGWAEALSGLRGRFEVVAGGEYPYGGIYLQCGRCGWRYEIQISDTLDALVQRAGEHGEVCR